MDITGGSGPIMHMIGLGKFLEIYKADRTFQAESPDSIDPDRTNANVPWVWRNTDDAGYANPIVARCFIQCAEAIKDKTLKRGDPNKILLALHSCKENLRNAEKAFLRLAVEHDRIVTTLEDTGGIRVDRGVVNDLPQIPSLDHEATVFLTSGKRALQSIAECLNEFYGISISNARFDKGIAQLKELKPVPNYILKELSNFSGLIERVLKLRNFQEHTPRMTEVKNFRLTADKLLAPMWQVSPEAERPMLPEMQEILGSLIEFVELSFFHSLMDNVSGHFARFYSVKEIPPDQRKEGSAIRFQCELVLASSDGRKAPNSSSD